MGKASSRKLPVSKAVSSSDAEPSPLNNKDVARSLLDAYDAFDRARMYSEALAVSMKSPKVRRWFHSLSLSLGDVQRVLGVGAREAQQTLGLPVSFAGSAGKASDGSRVAVSLDGVVQHSAPDAVLRELGLLPSANTSEGKARKARGK